MAGENQPDTIDAARVYDDFDLDDPRNDHSVGDFDIPIELSGSESKTILIFFGVTAQSGGKARLTLFLADECCGCSSNIPDAVLRAEHDFGAFDIGGLCGVYRIINAIRVLSPEIDQATTKSLFAE